MTEEENLVMFSDASHFQFKVTLVTFRAVPSFPPLPWAPHRAASVEDCTFTDLSILVV